jgi:hypothetical protein
VRRMVEAMFNTLADKRYAAQSVSKAIACALLAATIRPQPPLSLRSSRLRSCSS